MSASVASDEAHYFLNFAPGAFIGLFIAGLVVAFSWYWSQTRPGETLHKMPFTAAVLLKTVIYLVIIIVGLRPGAWRFGLGRSSASNPTW